MKTECESINKILEKATSALQTLKLKYDAEKTSDLVDKFTSEAKKSYLKELSETYYNEGKQMKKQYIQKICDEYDNLIKIEKESKKLKELERKKPKTQEQLLNDTNKLLYSTFILCHGSSEQIRALLSENREDIQVIELVKAKLNSVGREEKEHYNDVGQMLLDLARDRADDLLIQKNNYQNYLSSDSFPTINALQPDLAQIFEKTKYIQDEFFK